MREIKFKAWDTTHKKWYTKVNVGTDCCHSVYCDERNMWLQFDEFCGVVVQYTGLKDRNGIEIHEGDIVKQIYHAQSGHVYDGSDMSFDGHHIGQVVITASQGVCMRKPYCYSEETDETITTNQYKRIAGYRSEVIGNIYENPELLDLAS